jgi:hypothetical protein
MAKLGPCGIRGALLPVNDFEVANTGMGMGMSMGMDSSRLSTEKQAYARAHLLLSAMAWGCTEDAAATATTLTELLSGLMLLDAKLRGIASASRL